MPRHHLPFSVFMLLAVAALTVIPSCSTKKPPQQTTPPSTTSAPPQPHGVYEQCLTQHGVPSPAAGPAPGPSIEPQGPLPGPVEGTSTTPPPPPGVDQTTWDNAQKACASLQSTAPTTTGP
ncbi:MAG: hypothetical protein JO191_00505 [Mycobacteriaceae bacterium]|nr:hypothetical protein [Mycobacteriaceae bacterium]MBV9512997.1 hypothetical protein [Mycobacteriaceae bacterium]